MKVSMLNTPRKTTFHPPRPRRGSFTAELIIAFGLVGLILALAMQMLALLAVNHRNADQHAHARQEARNILEQLSLLDHPDPQSTAQLIKGFEHHVAATLPGAQLEVLIEESASDDDPPGLLRLQVIVRWNKRGGLPAPPVTLTTWVASTRDNDARDDNEAPSP